MFSRVRIAIRFFFVGLAVGVLLAPRSGEETRRMLRQKADRLMNDLLDAATLGTYESGTGMPKADDAKGTSGNGSATSSGTTSGTSSAKGNDTSSTTTNRSRSKSRSSDASEASEATA